MRLGVVLALLAVVPFGAWAWNRFAPRTTPAGQPPLERLGTGGAARVRAAFNAAAGQPRLLVLLSPT